jgi:hypothetical protein
MSHFEITEWTDFVRDVLAAERKAVLERHLAEGCPECAATCAVLRKAAVAAAADRAIDVPPELVAAAEAIFAERRQAKPSFLERIAARLIYDNIGEFQPSGARAGETVTRQVAFDAGDYYLDLTLGGDSTHCSLVGQFASKKAPSTPQADVPVLLLAGDTVVRRTVTNEFGEFSLDYRPRRNLRLCLPLAAEGTQVEVSLKELQ